MDLTLNLSNRDYYDDGLVLPFNTNPCGLTQMNLALNSWAGISVSHVYVNVLVDFDRDGGWSGASESADEWAIKNYKVELVKGEEQVVPLPAISDTLRTVSCLDSSRIERHPCDAFILQHKRGLGRKRLLQLLRSRELLHRLTRSDKCVKGRG